MDMIISSLIKRDDQDWEATNKLFWIDCIGAVALQTIAEGSLKFFMAESGSMKSSAKAMARALEYFVSKPATSSKQSTMPKQLNIYMRPAERGENMIG